MPIPRPRRSKSYRELLRAHRAAGQVTVSRNAQPVDLPPGVCNTQTVPANSLRLLILLLVCSLVVAVYFAQTSNPVKSKEPVAVVAGKTIYEDDLLPLIQAQLRQLRNQEYELKSRALENLVNQKLLEAEAEKKGMAIGKLLQQEVDAKVAEPTEAELLAEYLSQRNRLNRPFEEVKAQLQQALRQPRLQAARQEYMERLRELARVSILLRPPRVEVAYDRTRLRGSPNAPVIIVEFSDFQCPFCRQVQPTLKNLLAKYEGRVSLAYRDFPLQEIHPQAQLAAEASRCANQQGQFWPYHDLLFANPNRLKQEDLLEHARSLKLDEKQFNSCLSSGEYKARVEEDLEEGRRVGVNGTPGFFINGILLSGARPQAAFEEVVQRELAARKDKRAVQ